MEVKIERHALLPALKASCAVAPRHTRIPVLRNVCIKAHQGLGGVTISATDADNEIEVDAKADVLKAGSCTVEGRAFRSLVQALDAKTPIVLKLVEDDARKSPPLMVLQGSFEGRIETLPAQDMPHVFENKKPGNDYRFTIGAAKLRFMIDRVRHAISGEETRYYLNGIHFHPIQTDDGSEKSLRAVATDGHRLSLASVPLDDLPPGFPDNLIVPHAAVRLLYDHLCAAKTEGPVDVLVRGSRLRFAKPGTRLMSKRIDGTFPDYEQVTPQERNLRPSFDRAAVLRLLGRMRAVYTAIGTTRAVKIELAASEALITATDSSNGVFRETIPCEGGASTEIVLGVNIHYLADALSKVDDERVIMELSNTSADPIILRGTLDSQSLHVIMPLRI